MCSQYMTSLSKNTPPDLGQFRLNSKSFWGFRYWANVPYLHLRPYSEMHTVLLSAKERHMQKQTHTHIEQFIMSQGEWVAHMLVLGDNGVSLLTRITFPAPIPIIQTLFQRRTKSIKQTAASSSWIKSSPPTNHPKCQYTESYMECSKTLAPRRKGMLRRRAMMLKWICSEQHKSACSHPSIDVGAFDGLCDAQSRFSALNTRKKNKVNKKRKT